MKIFRNFFIFDTQKSKKYLKAYFLCYVFLFYRMFFIEDFMFFFCYFCICCVFMDCLNKYPYFRINEDMAFATNSGFQKLLVLSGVSKKEDLENWEHSDNTKPQYYVGSLKDVYQALKHIYPNLG